MDGIEMGGGDMDSNGKSGGNIIVWIAECVNCSWAILHVLYWWCYFALVQMLPTFEMYLFE